MVTYYWSTLSISSYAWLTLYTFFWDTRYFVLWQAVALFWYKNYNLLIFNITVTLEVLPIILTHSALKFCPITWGRYNLWWKIWVVHFFHILSKHYICGYYGQVYVDKNFSFVTALLHVKVLSWIAWREKTGHWLPFSLYNPHFFLEILDQESALFNFSEKNVNFILKSWHVPCSYFPPFEEVVHLLFNWTLYKTWSCDAGEFLH